MPRKPQTPARPRDLNQLAHRIGQIATHEVVDTMPPPVDGAATKRGESRATKLTAERRREIARKAAAARWKNKGRG